MPVPTREETTGPRRLLRDVVYDQILAAIVDGTLEPGERLNDSELSAWLGASRTPIREAIAQLASYGLVEIEANRFTRVASLDDDLYAEASQFLAGIHSLGRQWGLGNLSAADRKQIRHDLKAVRKAAAARDLKAPGLFLDVQGHLVRASGNALMVGTEEPLRTRVKFLSPRDASAFDWKALVASAEELQNACEE
ncbi:DNA-binding GntR family transcriptional regulator [Frigoribacterium sp. PhB160]|uniref:GntR family transcriptional regulator n=1 Tax=Frigoribacterium sp. PhB160 TaxID=2485192 RepID=UPI000F46E61F|nr:GntR family transcriptional regulator [Frigoribacterium sp. PhB160]ROS61077.1 DNA-binding GntR family transcriptional regulator [Frigoribacterium sp. PhB160]